MQDNIEAQPQSIHTPISSSQSSGMVVGLADTGAGAGGDGNVTSFKDNGGHLLTQVQVVLIFWGAAWAATPPPTPSLDQVVAAIQGIPSGPYLAKLKQYRGIGKGSVVKIDSNTDSDPQPQFTNDEVVQMIKDRIKSGKVPVPTDETFYCAILPQEHTYKDSPLDVSYVGYHETFDWNGTKTYYAWVTNNGDLDTHDSIPKIFSHELAEACTDPDGSTGIKVTGSFIGDEIGDACNDTFLIINGVALQTYWS